VKITTEGPGSFKELLIKSGLYGLAITTDERAEVIILKHPKDEDGHKALMTYEVDSPNAVKMREEVRTVNRWLKGFKFECLGRELKPSFRRIFNNGVFTDGGRWYASYQNMLSEERNEITIDGQRTAEINFKGMHAVMLYGEIKERYDGDPYLIDGLEHLRNDAKTAFHIMINAKDWKGCFGAVVAEFLSPTKPKYRGGPQGKPRCSSYEEAKFLALKVINGLKRMHPKISQMFHSGHGVKMQKQDSDIAALIFQTAIANGTPCLMFHDSAIVKSDETSISWMRQTMEDASEAILKFRLKTEVKVPKRPSKVQPDGTPEVIAEVIPLPLLPKKPKAA
jgi:hypothetical protein